jgi:hypothetical protein
VVERSWKRYPNRVDHRFAFERNWNARPPVSGRDDEDEEAGGPALRERLDVVVAGDRVTKAWRTVVLPGAAERAQRERQAPREGLEALGFALLSLGGIAAFTVALRRLAAGGIRLGPPAKLTVVVGLLLLAVHTLQQPVLFERWDPLWPRWIAELRDLAYDLIDDLAALLMLFFFLLAGDALDRQPRLDGSAPGRAASLWALGRGELRDPAVVAASVRGFLVGALCGGVLALGVLLTIACGGRISLQPRGFFFYPLNSVFPALTTLCFFAHIALIEELGYRFFAGTWLERLTGRRWLAILIPAAVYGLCHTAFDFLPPADPFWVRPLLLGAVGCVWGWAFFRFDALTVVLSHFTCDLFIFNWPSLAGGGGGAALAAIALSVPLWPAAIGMLLRRRSGAGAPTYHTPEV